MCKSFQLSKPWANKKKGLRRSPKKKIKNLNYFIHIKKIHIILECGRNIIQVLQV